MNLSFWKVTFCTSHIVQSIVHSWRQYSFLQFCTSKFTKLANLHLKLSLDLEKWQNLYKGYIRQIYEDFTLLVLTSSHSETKLQKYAKKFPDFPPSLTILISKLYLSEHEHEFWRGYISHWWSCAVGQVMQYCPTEFWEKTTSISRWRSVAGYEEFRSDYRMFLR